ncbi:DNA polymerase delta small subunit, putative [Plasmodium vivax]|uniref:DNA polymerase delta small subunit n=3 Tax=Plasmodium vivax TaxID=5855 RepID=A0A0J9TFT4_PLAVI|nr:DNA polymerase delta small subunit [Plasmodium vivax Mauritania I]KMZ99904.1 DNA polymerase delta small subunit [Plasmodium vivax North Korean]SCO72430.1 DNA polymerase delta small subunit, putative [Plasmodium vivax]
MSEDASKRAKPEFEGDCEFPLQKKVKKGHYNYENQSKGFLIGKATYTQQYCEIYSARTKAMKGLLVRTVERLGGGGGQVSGQLNGHVKAELGCKVKGEDAGSGTGEETGSGTGEDTGEGTGEVKSEGTGDGTGDGTGRSCGGKAYPLLHYLKEIKTNENCYCIGTLFKKMELRPSILNEYISEINEAEDVVVNYSHDEDVLFLEDETARLKLEGNINSDHYVTGLTVIIKGTGMSNGSLYVEELIYAYVPKLEVPRCISDDDKYILFVSGLYISEQNENGHNTSLLKNFILGLHGDKHLSEKLIRVVIVGNCLRNVESNEKDMNTVDTFLASLCPAVYVDLMPGEKDPSDAILPQQPFPNLFFKTARSYSSFQCVTNPYLFSIDGVNVCCMSGEPVNNIVSYSKNCPLDALKMIAKSRILSPTSPDTLGCYPFIEKDPFCLPDDDKYPHIFVNGNCAQLEVQHLHGEKTLPLLACLPSFDVTPKALLVNIRNMQHVTLSFDVGEGSAIQK